MKFLDMIFAARPMLLIPVWSIYLVAFGTVNKHAPLSAENLLILLADSFIFAGAYYVNQIFDYESDLINMKLGFLQRNMLSRRDMWLGFIVCSLAATAIGFSQGPAAGLPVAMILVLGIFYSAPPVRLKDRPITGMLSNSIAYGVLLPLTVPVFLPWESGRLGGIPLYFFLAVSAGYVLTIIPDREGDIKTGKKTLAFHLSDRMLLLSGILLLAGSAVAAYSINSTWLVAVSVVSIILFAVAASYNNEKMILFACKAPILLLALLAGYFFPGYLIFLAAVLLITKIYYRRRFDIDYPRMS